MQTRVSEHPLNVVHRICISLLGSYAFAWGLTAFGVATLYALGVDFHEAETAMMILGFIVFLPLFLWAFATRSLPRVWLVLAGGALTMTAAAWAVQNAVLS